MSTDARISTLFPDKNVAVQALMKGPLAMVAYNYFPGLTFDPDYLYEKLLAAEADISHTLGVRFVPTKFFPLPPTDAQLATIPDTMPYDIDAGYDYTPDMFMRDQWGFVVLRNKPIISVDAINFAYPAATSSFSIIRWTGCATTPSMRRSSLSRHRRMHSSRWIRS